MNFDFRFLHDSVSWYEKKLEGKLDGNARLLFRKIKEVFSAMDALEDFSDVFPQNEISEEITKEKCWAIAELRVFFRERVISAEEEKK